MKASILYKSSSALLVLFAAGHTYGMFRPPSTRATIDTITFAMRNFHFEIMGFTRSLWDFYFGFGMLLSVFLLFSAFLSWYLGSLGRTSSVLPLAWAFAGCYGAVAVLCWIYFFLAPALVSTVVAACLAVAAVQNHTS